MNKIKYGSDKKLEFETKNISIIGGNGSGKSSLMRNIGRMNSSSVEIAAHKNLTIQQGQYRGQKDQWLVQHGSSFLSPTLGDRNKPTDNNSVQTDFNQIIEIIFREYNDESILALNAGKTLEDINRKLDEVIDAWNLIFVDKKIEYKNKKIEVNVVGSDTYYDIENLSDGERVALYVLIKVRLANDNSTIIIDEPETFLNPALLDSLFDEAEKMRKDCKFVYFSHDLEFITTREDNTIFWIKNFTFPETFEIEKIDGVTIPNEVIIKVIGTKKTKILFVESVDNKDAKLYQLLYPEFKVWPVGSCDNVINYTKAFNLGVEKFNKKYFGLVDADFRSKEEVQKLINSKVFTIPVSIFENLFFIEEIVIFILNYLGDVDIESKIELLKSRVQNLVESENFKNRYKKAKLQNNFNQQIVTLVENESIFEFDFDLVNKEIEEFKSMDNKEVIKKINTKDITSCASILGFNWNSWRNQVINVFNTEKGDELQDKFLEIMPEIK